MFLGVRYYTYNNLWEYSYHFLLGLGHGFLVSMYVAQIGVLIILATQAYKTNSINLFYKYKKINSWNDKLLFLESGLGENSLLIGVICLI